MCGKKISRLIELCRYEYYGDGRAPNDPNNHDNRGGEQTGVELIELANGDTIW